MDKENMMYYNLNATFVGDSNLKPGRRFRYMVNAFQYYHAGDAGDALVADVNKLSALSAALTELENMIENMSRGDVARSIYEAAHYANDSIRTFSVNGPIAEAPSKEEISCITDKIMELEHELSAVNICAIAEFIRKKAIAKGDM